MFTIQDLEQLVPPQILERGRDYYRRGLVKRLRQRDDTFEATVRGTDLYHVVLTLEFTGPPDITCDCPYDYGLVCKHCVAVALAVLDKLGQNTRQPAAPAPPVAAPDYTTPQLQKALVKAFGHLSDREKAAYLGQLLYRRPDLIREFLETFEFRLPALLAVSVPKVKPRTRTFVEVGEELWQTGYKPDLLPHLLRYDWRGLIEDEVPRLVALLAHAARQQPEATLDAVMERIEKYLAATQRGPGFYPRLVGWLAALHEVPAVAAEVRLFASELHRQHGRRPELRGALTEAGFALLPADEQEQAWSRKEAAAAKKPPQKRGRKAR